jgi:beta-glucosidase
MKQITFNRSTTSSSKTALQTISFALALSLGLTACMPKQELPEQPVDETGAANSEPTDSSNEGQDSASLTPEQQKAAKIWPKLNVAVKPVASEEVKVAEILSSMTLEQKIAQMIQPEIRDVTVEDMRRYGFGSYLNGGGAFPNNNKQATPQDWVELAEKLYQASIDDSLDGSTIPTMWGTDAVHGHNNVIGATLFPHNIGLGAANNPDLIEKIANATAKEVLATGIDWVFAPTVAVVRDDRWGRTYESYSEDPKIVHDYAAAIVSGLQGGSGESFLDQEHVISTVKHFVGDGGTVGGDDQGDNISTEQALFDIHAQGYVGGLTAGAQSVMATFNSWHGDKIHGNKYLLTTVLKETMGFDGFVVGDWNGHGQVKGCDNTSCPQAINAGLDIFMAPTTSWKPLFENTVEQVKQGVISMSRINDAVTRILRVKVRAGLFDKPSPEKRSLAGNKSIIGHPDHRAIARQAVQESLVLLKNNAGVLPLNPNQRILVAGDAADNIGKQSGG